VNLEPIVSRCVTGAFSYQGQVCISLQRIYAVDEVYEAFTEKFVAAARRLKIGDPLCPETDVSALIRERDLKRSLDWIEEAVRMGAKVALGGKAEGGILLPTVLLEVDTAARVSCKEVFAPIVLVNKVSSVEEAVEHVNRSDYGLQAGIYTDNIRTALDAADNLHVGGVMINDIPTFRVDQMPYGGVKQSGMGREGLKYAVEEMTELKLVVVNRN
jgi:acyl-CoA reductase-like NAD-dependent aldehyde dehydrogenase